MIFEGQSANRSLTGFAGAFNGKGAATKAMMGMNPASTMPNYSMFGANAQNTYKQGVHNNGPNDRGGNP